MQLVRIMLESGCSRKNDFGISLNSSRMRFCSLDLVLRTVPYSIQYAAYHINIAFVSYIFNFLHIYLFKNGLYHVHLFKSMVYDYDCFYVYLFFAMIFAVHVHRFIT